MKRGRILLLTPNLKGVADGVNRIGPSLGLMLIAQPLIDSGHIVKIHDVALEGWNNKKKIQSNRVKFKFGTITQHVRNYPIPLNSINFEDI